MLIREQRKLSILLSCLILFFSAKSLFYLFTLSDKCILFLLASSMIRLKFLLFDCNVFNFFVSLCNYFSTLTKVAYNFASSTGFNNFLALAFFSLRVSLARFISSSRRIVDRRSCSRACVKWSIWF